MTITVENCKIYPNLEDGLNARGDLLIALKERIGLFLISIFKESEKITTTKTMKARLEHYQNDSRIFAIKIPEFHEMDLLSLTDEDFIAKDACATRFIGRFGEGKKPCVLLAEKDEDGIAFRTIDLRNHKSVAFKDLKALKNFRCIEIDNVTLNARIDTMIPTAPQSKLPVTISIPGLMNIKISEMR